MNLLIHPSPHLLIYLELSQNTICHCELFTSFKDKLREESLISVSQRLRLAQGDSFEIFSYSLKGGKSPAKASRIHSNISSSEITDTL